MSPLVAAVTATLAILGVLAVLCAVAVLVGSLLGGAADVRPGPVPSPRPLPAATLGS